VYAPTGKPLVNVFGSAPPDRMVCRSASATVLCMNGASFQGRSQRFPSRLNLSISPDMKHSMVR